MAFINTKDYQRAIHFCPSEKSDEFKIVILLSSQLSSSCKDFYDYDIDDDLSLAAFMTAAHVDDLFALVSLLARCIALLNHL